MNGYCCFAENWETRKSCFFYVVNIYTFQFKKFTVQGNIKDSLKIHSKVKWLNKLNKLNYFENERIKKLIEMNTARFLKYVWPFCNIMHERVKTFC